MLVHSSNDAAVVLSQQLAGSEKSLIKWLKKGLLVLAQPTQMSRQPSGLNDVKGNVTTARDLALICTEAMKNPGFS
jgi:D-alanyl-D-alanine carboxypeptidase